MRLRGIMVALAVLALGACDAGALTDASRDMAGPRPDAGPRASLEDGGYPTEDEYAAAGGTSASVLEPECCASGNFSGDMRTWSGTGKFALRWVNDASANLSIAVVDHTNGSTLNSGGDSYQYTAQLPILTRAAITLNSSIGTLGRNCGITGKSRLVANAATKVLATRDGALITIWSGSLDVSAPDKAAADCVVVEECSSNMYYANGDCNESEEPAGDGEGGSGGGGGGVDGGTPGGGGYCILWQVTIYESAEKREILDQYYYWECF